MDTSINFLYRYRGINEKTIQGLVNDELHFSSPKYFNDQFEFKPFIDKEELRVEIKRYLKKYDKVQNATILRSLKNMFFNNVLGKVIEISKHFQETGDLTRDEVVLINEIVLEYFCNGDLYHSTRTIHKYIEDIIAKISDIYDRLEEINPSLYSYIDDSYISELNKYSHVSKIDFYMDYMIEQYYSFTFGKFHVTCFSTDFDSAPMWGNYANNLSGIVVGYKTEDLIASGIEFKQDSVLWCDYLPSKKGILKQVHYMDEVDCNHVPYIMDLFHHIVYYDILGNKKKDSRKAKFNVDYFYVKSLKWSYEKEFRIVKSGSKPHKIKPAVIYIGSRVSLRDKIDIIDIAKSKNISCFFMEDNPSISHKNYMFKKIF